MEESNEIVQEEQKERIPVEFNSSTASYSSKASYGDEKYYEEEEGKYYYRIEWQTNDQVGILSPNIRTTQALYYVKSVENNGRYSKARFKSSGVDDALCWGEPGSYTFYGMYPYSENGLQSDGKASFTLPQVQTSSSEKWVGDSYVASPNPDYMQMTACASVAKTQEVKSPEVLLPFVMLPTVLHFKISGAADMNVKSISLISANDNVCGDFTAAISSEEQYPSCVSGSGYKTVSMTFNGGNHASVNKGKYLECYFFLLPTKSFSDITFRIALDYDSVESVVSTALKVGGQAYVFEPHKRYDVEGLVIPNAVKWTIRETITVDPWKNVDVDLN